MVTEPWELIARERIRDTLALYTWSGDSFRLEGLASAFRQDGVLELPGREPIRGRRAIIEFLGGGATGDDDARRSAARAAASERDVKRLVRHSVTNVRFLELTHLQARVDSYYTVFTEKGLDHLGRYRDVFEPVGDVWLISHRLASTDWRSETSTMAPPPQV
jgi:hypothetical protein